MIDGWAKARASNLYLSRTDGCSIQYRQCIGAAAAIPAQRLQWLLQSRGGCTVTPNPGLEQVHRSSSAQPCFRVKQTSWANRPGFILSTLHKGTWLYSLCVITEYFNIWISMPPAPQPTYIPRVTKKSSKITATVVYVYEVRFFKGSKLIQIKINLQRNPQRHFFSMREVSLPHFKFQL